LLAKHCRGACNRLGIAIDQDDAGTLACQNPSNSESDAPASAGDDCALSLEPAWHS
jgi:hypothetical protein